MSDIYRTQEQFFQYILGNENHEFVESGDAKQRLEIYKSTININLTNSLKLTYPGIWQLVGEECANNLALLFCKQHKYLPKTGCLDDFGKEFSDFLTTITELSHLPYLAEYAQLEWLKHLSYMAKNQTSIADTYLFNLPADLLADSIFIFNDACYLFSAKYDIAQIDNLLYNKTESINLNNHNSYGLVCRQKNKTSIIWLDYTTYLFLLKLKSKYTLSETISYLEKQNINFNLPELINFLLINKIIAKLLLKGGEQND